MIGDLRLLGCGRDGARLWIAPIICVIALGSWGCGDDTDVTDRDTDVTSTQDVGADAHDTADAADAGQLSYPVSECDPLVEQQCAMPWPSNLYLAPDQARETGFTLTFGATSLPATGAGRQINQFLRQGEIIDICGDAPCQFDP